MNPTAGSFVIDPRLQRLFATFAVETPSLDSLMTIFGCFLHGHLKKFSTGEVAASGPTSQLFIQWTDYRLRHSACCATVNLHRLLPHELPAQPSPPLAPPAEVQELGTKILQAALALHERVCATFRKTAVNHHYEFTVSCQCLLLRAAWSAMLWVHASHDHGPSPRLRCHRYASCSRCSRASCSPPPSATMQIPPSSSASGCMSRKGHVSAGGRGEGGWEAGDLPDRLLG